MQFHPPEIRILTCEYCLLQDWYANDNVWPFWRIYHNEAEGASILFKDETIAIGADEIVMIAPGAVVGRRLLGELHHFYIHATASWPFNSSLPAIHRFPTEPWLLRLIDGIKHDCIRAETKPLGAKRETQLLAIVAYALGQIADEFLQSEAIDARIARVLAHIEDCYTSKVTNDELAAVAGLARSSFIRLFTQQIGQAPHRYILQKRMDRAASMLAHSALTIDDIAESCGFSNRNYFTRLFSRHCRQAPAAFRRNATL